MSYEISKNYKNTDYNELSLKVGSDSDSWWNAIKMLKERIEERFFSPLDELIAIESNENPKDRKFWFCILAITCLLIETIQWFREWIYNHKSKSWDLIRWFMARIDFDCNESKSFYEKVRCWILHKWEVENYKIWSVWKEIMNNWIINRTKLYKKVKEEFYIYLEELNSSDKLKRNFIKVMDWICETHSLK